MNDPVAVALLVLAGLAAGFINTLAGGGSMLTLPALMALGLPADVANGTNRLAVVTQSGGGIIAFQRKGKLPTREAPGVVSLTVLGAIVGAAASAWWIPREHLKIVLLSTMALVALVMIARPNALAPEEGETRSLRGTPRAWAGLFLAGVYGGFVQAGVGFVLLAVIGGTLRFDLVRGNALKLACTFVYGIVALGIFIAADQVEWIPATALAVSTLIGAQLGVRFALNVPAKVIRAVVLCAVLVALGAALLEVVRS